MFLSIIIYLCFVIPESTDYSVLFYIFDGCCFMVLVLSFWLKVSMKRSALSTKESLKKIWNKASLIFFSILFVVGTLYGVKDTYLIPYLTEDLGASSQLISKQKHRYISDKNFNLTTLQVP